MYCFNMRERILTCLKWSCGSADDHQLLLASAACRWPLPGAFIEATRAFLKEFTWNLKEFEIMLTHNPIWLSRTKAWVCLRDKEGHWLSEASPDRCLRAAGVPLDLRKVRPYSGYDQFDFDIPTSTDADCYARYEGTDSGVGPVVCRIIEQAMNKLKPGPYRTEDRKVALPPREEITTSMESLIHHFKLVTEGYRRRWVRFTMWLKTHKAGWALASSATAHPCRHRLRVRGPSFVNLQATDPRVARHGYVSDLNYHYRLH